jgi:hypothetical protein
MSIASYKHFPEIEADPYGGKAILCMHAFLFSLLIYVYVYIFIFKRCPHIAKI